QDLSIGGFGIRYAIESNAVGDVEGLVVGQVQGGVGDENGARESAGAAGAAIIGIEHELELAAAVGDQSFDLQSGRAAERAVEAEVARVPANVVAVGIADDPLGPCRADVHGSADDGAPWASIAAAGAKVGSEARVGLTGRGVAELER